MTKFKFGKYPKPWEISASKFLAFVLPFCQWGVFIYAIVLLFAPIIPWLQILILFLLTIAIAYCSKNARAILEYVNENNPSGE
jgi:hypothetical protein